MKRYQLYLEAIVAADAASALGFRATSAALFQIAMSCLDDTPAQIVRGLPIERGCQLALSSQH